MLNRTLAPLRQWLISVGLICLFASQVGAQSQDAKLDAVAQSPALATAKPVGKSLQNFPVIPLTKQTSQIRLGGLTQYWLDDSQDTTVSAMEARASAGVDLFKPSRAGDTHPAHGKTLWLRFETHALDTRSRWLLELDTPRLDDVQLFWRDSNNRWLTLKSGDSVPNSGWPMQTRIPVFALEQDGSMPQTYYLRIVNARSPVSSEMMIYRDTRFIEQQQFEMMLLGSFFGLVVVMLMASLGLAALMRERSFLAYSGYISSLSLYMFCNVGLAALYFWPHSSLIADRAVFVTASVTAALGPWFVRMILQPVTRLRFINTMIAILVILMLSIAVVEAIHPTRLSFAILNAGTFASLIVIYVVIFATWQRGDANTRLIALGFLPVALSAIPVILRNLGMIPNSVFTQYSLLFAATVEMPVLLYALLVKSAGRRDSHMRAAGLPTRDALTGLSNMRALLDQMHGVMTRAARYRHPYGLILIELTNEAWFAKEHGREIADRALIMQAVRLQNLAREVDTTCRIEGNQFILLIEGPCSPRQMAQITARISAGSHTPDDVLPVGSSLKLRITSALLPTAESQQAGDDAQAQLGWLIAAAESPADQRKAVVSIGF
jgi:two-component system, sensor histidine kinase LadS